MISTVNRTMLYGTRSRTDSLNTLRATALMARTDCLRIRRAWSGVGHVLDEEVLERIAQRVNRDDFCARRGDFRDHAFGRLVERQLQRVAPRGDLRRACDPLRQPRDH